MSLNRLSDRVVIVTGAASGIGQATAIRLASEGAKVLASDINEAGLAETLATITDAGGEAITHQADISQEADAAGTVAAAVDAWVVSTASRTSPACCARGAPTSSASTAGTRSSPSTSPAPS
ncbi:MAG: SDR family NAD(P)-dependent oxidoreductase [Microthrixaceae bacterium]